MNRPKKQAGAMNATEFIAQLQRDKEYQAKDAAFEAELQERVRALRVAEQPIVADLRAAGVEVDSVWDLVNTSDPYPAALPVLMDHLERGGYPDRVMEGLGRAMGVEPAVTFWDRLKSLYLGSRNAGEEEGTAVALAACAKKEHLDDLVGFLSIEARGESRIYFLRPIRRLGGDRGRAVLESLRGDKTFGREVGALLGQGKRPGRTRGRAQRPRP